MKDITLRDKLGTADYWLQQWAVWCNKLKTQGLHFHSKTLLSELVSHKGSIIRATRMHHYQSCTEVEKVEELLNALTQIQPLIAKVLAFHYANDLPLKQKITVLNVKRANYFRLLNQGKAWIGEHFVKE